MRIESLALEYDRAYGIDRRRGWTVKINGVVVTQLQPWLVVAIYKAIKAAITRRDWIWGDHAPNARMSDSGGK